MFWNFNKMQLGTSYFYEPHPWSSCRITNVSMREPLVMVQLLLFIFTGRNEVVAKVMFLHVCVILFTGGVSGQGEPPRSRHPPPGADTTTTPRADTFPGADTTPPQSRHPPRKHSPAYGQRAAGKHPTGMHSC